MQKTVAKCHELKNDVNLLANNGQRLIDFLFDSPADLVENVLRYYSSVTLGDTMKARVNHRARDDVRFSEHVRRCLIDASNLNIFLFKCQACRASFVYFTVDLSTSLKDKAYFALRLHKVTTTVPTVSLT